MKTVLVRHRKPEIDDAVWVTAADFGRWIECYARAGIDTRTVPRKSVMSEVQSCSMVV